MATTLVIDTATAACSIALIDDDAVLAQRHETVGRGHAERLLPMIAELPGGGRADRVLVDCGPGSFTGVRVGLAAARALGLGWGVPVAGYSSTALVAAAEFARDPASEGLAVVLEGGHGEVFVQLFSRPLCADGPLMSLRPPEARAACGDRRIVGSGVRWLADVSDQVEALPRAADAPLLPCALAGLAPTPIYGRAPDAKPAAAR